MRSWEHGRWRLLLPLCVVRWRLVRGTCVQHFPSCGSRSLPWTDRPVTSGAHSGAFWSFTITGRADVNTCSLLFVRVFYWINTQAWGCWAVGTVLALLETRHTLFSTPFAPRHIPVGPGRAFQVPWPGQHMKWGLLFVACRLVCSGGLRCLSLRFPNERTLGSFPVLCCASVHPLHLLWWPFTSVIY